MWVTERTFEAQLFVVLFVAAAFFNALFVTAMFVTAGMPAAAFWPGDVLKAATVPIEHDCCCCSDITDASMSYLASRAAQTDISCCSANFDDTPMTPTDFLYIKPKVCMFT